MKELLVYQLPALLILGGLETLGLYLYLFVCVLLGSTAISLAGVTKLESPLT